MIHFLLTVLTVLCAVVTSILYRAGGLSQEQKYWIPKFLRHSWVRDWGCPFFCLLPLFLQHPHWLFIPVYGLMGAAFTTYWDKLFKKDNFWFSGFALGLAALPLAFCGFSFWMIGARALFLAISWGVWCLIFGNDHLEEHGRGFFAGISSIFII